MWNGLSTDDMCIDYKLKFGIEFNKLRNKEIQFGFSLNKHCYGTYVGDRYEYYLYLSLFKWYISIGWFLKEEKESDVK